MNNNNFKCESCNIEQDILYHGWFRHPHYNQEFFQGTTTSGLLRQMRVCKSCLSILIKNGTACAEQFPD